MADSPKGHIKSILPEPQREDFYEFFRRAAHSESPASSKEAIRGQNGSSSGRTRPHTSAKILAKQRGKFHR